MFPERFSRKAIDALKEDLGEYGFYGQLQQRPTPLGGGMLKTVWWRLWPDDKPFPHCDHVFLSWDTAYTERDMKTNSYSAMTAWGIFYHEQEQRYCLFLLARWYGRVDYPTLRKMAQQLSNDKNPDAHLIEKKASGISLIQDLRRAGRGKKRVMLRAYNPDTDKIARAAVASAPLQAGLVFAPNRAWAEEVIQNCAAFPAGEPPSSDLTDTVTQAILYLKKRYWIEHPDDVDEDNQVGSREDYDEADRDSIEENHHGVYG